MDIHQFTFAFAFKHVLVNEFGLEIYDTQLLAHLTAESLFWRLAIVYVTANGCVPFPWLDVLPFRPSLQIHLALGVKHMQMHHRV